MSTKNLLSQAATKKEVVSPTLSETTRDQIAKQGRIKKTITLDTITVKALHKLKAHISIEEDTQTDFGRIIDQAVLELLKAKGLSN